jgi:hypothetical protein
MKRLHVGAVAALLMAVCTSVQAQTSTDIIRVEEDWVALIRNPDAVSGAPQIVNAMSPDGSMDSSYGLFEINHTSSPEFAKGGFQVQSWHNRTLLSRRNSSKQNVLSNDYDRLEYTTVMELSDGQLKYQMINGKSRTWGIFGQSGDLYASSPSSLTAFSSYNRQDSVDNSSVNVGAHRVEALYQRRVRLYSAEGLVSDSDDIRVIHRYEKIVTDELMLLWETNPSYFNVAITE